MGPNAGRKLKEIRERLGVSQKELAMRMGVDPSLLSHLEAGRKPVRLGHVILFAAALGLKAEEVVKELMREEKEEKNHA